MVVWSDAPQPGFSAPQAPLAESGERSDSPAGVQRLGDLLPAVLARHGLAEEQSVEATPARQLQLDLPMVVPQPECPAS